MTESRPAATGTTTSPPRRTGVTIACALTWWGFWVMVRFVGGEQVTAPSSFLFRLSGPLDLFAPWLAFLLPLHLVPGLGSFLSSSETSLRVVEVGWSAVIALLTALVGRWWHPRKAGRITAVTLGATCVMLVMVRWIVELRPFHGQLYPLLASVSVTWLVALVVATDLYIAVGLIAVAMRTFRRPPGHTPST